MERRLLYHITDYRNLPDILKLGGLAAHSLVRAKGISYTNIAHQNIQSRRSTTKIPVSPYGVLHDYVPFYFAPRSPMLYAILSGKVEGYSGSQEDIIYLVTDTEIIHRAGKKYVFTDGHAIMALTKFFTDPSDLCHVDWEVMKFTYWNDTHEDPDRSRRRQAEFLVYQFVELKYFLGIAVKTERMKEKVMSILDSHDIAITVRVVPSFYY